MERTTFRDGMKIRSVRRPLGGREHGAVLAGGSGFGGNRAAGQGAKPRRVKRGESSFENHMRFTFAGEAGSLLASRTQILRRAAVEGDPRKN